MPNTLSQIAQNSSGYPTYTFATYYRSPNADTSTRGADSLNTTHNCHTTNNSPRTCYRAPHDARLWNSPPLCKPNDHTKPLKVAVETDTNDYANTNRSSSKCSSNPSNNSLDTNDRRMCQIHAHHMLTSYCYPCRQNYPNCHCLNPNSSSPDAQNRHKHSQRCNLNKSPVRRDLEGHRNNSNTPFPHCNWDSGKGHGVQSPRRHLSACRNYRHSSFLQSSSPNHSRYVVKPENMFTL